MTNKELVNKAIIATDQLAAAGKLNPKQADKFIDLVIDVTGLSGNVRVARFRNEQLDIDKINVGKILDLERTIVGGLSAGGELSIWLALSGTIPVQKFIVIAPGGQWMNEPEKWQPLIDDSANRNVKGMIILGEEDKAIPHKSIERVVDMLNNGGISCEYIKYPGLGHWYPPDFNDILSSFIQKKD